MNLKNKTVVVTGASDGIGKHIAKELAKEKVKLVLIGRNILRLKKVKEEVIKLGSPQAKTYICDLQDSSQIKLCVEKIIQDFGSIQVLVNNAGIWQKRGQLEEIDDKQVQEIIQTNLLGTIFFTKHLLPTLREQAEAAIINISSRSGVKAQAGQSVYTASKWAVRGFTKVLVEDLKNTNIKVAGVYQGGTNTDLFKKAGEDWSDEKYSSFIPPQELAKTIVFMLSRPANIWLSDVGIEGY